MTMPSLWMIQLNSFLKYYQNILYIGFIVIILTSNEIDGAKDIIWNEHLNQYVEIENYIHPIMKDSESTSGVINNDTFFEYASNDTYESIKNTKDNEILINEQASSPNCGYINPKPSLKAGESAPPPPPPYFGKCIDQDMFDNFPVGKVETGWKAQALVDGLKLTIKNNLELQVLEDATNKNDHVLSVTDGGDNAIWYYKLPDQMGTRDKPIDHAAWVNGILKFRMKVVTTNDAQPLPNDSHGLLADVVLVGGTTFTVLGYYFRRSTTCDPLPKINEMSSFKIPLTYMPSIDETVENAWVKKGDAFDDATTANELADVLSNLQAIYIRGKYYSTTGTTVIDDFSIEGCSIMGSCMNGSSPNAQACKCDCAPGYGGKLCEHQLEFDVQMVSPTGSGTSQCLTLCHIETNTGLMDTSGLKDFDRLGSGISLMDCSEKRNSTFVLGMTYRIMLETCGGYRNQLWRVNKPTGQGKYCLMNVGMRGYCMAAPCTNDEECLKDEQGTLIESPNKDNSLTIIECQNLKRLLWNREVVSDLQEYTFRFTTLVKTTIDPKDKNKQIELKDKSCLDVNVSWLKTCRSSCDGESKDLCVLNSYCNNDGTGRTMVIQNCVKPTTDGGKSSEVTNGFWFRATSASGVELMTETQLELNESFINYNDTYNNKNEYNSYYYNESFIAATQSSLALEEEHDSVTDGGLWPMLHHVDSPHVVPHWTAK